MCHWNHLEFIINKTPHLDVGALLPGALHQDTSTVVKRAQGGSLHRPSCCPCRPCRHRWLRCLPPPQPHHPPPARRPGLRRLRKALATKSRWRHEVPPKFPATEIRKSRADQVLSAQGKPSIAKLFISNNGTCCFLQISAERDQIGIKRVWGSPIKHSRHPSPQNQMRSEPIAVHIWITFLSHSNPLTNWIYCNLQCYAPVLCTHLGSNMIKSMWGICQQPSESIDPTGKLVLRPKKVQLGTQICNGNFRLVSMKMFLKGKMELPLFKNVQNVCSQKIVMRSPTPSRRQNSPAKEQQLWAKRSWRNKRGSWELRDLDFPTLSTISYTSNSSEQGTPNW